MALAFNFWQFSNQQLLSYPKGGPKDQLRPQITESVVSNHLVSEYFNNFDYLMSNSGPALLLFIGLMAGTIYELILKRIINYVKSKYELDNCGPGNSILRAEWEGFHPYFENLEKKDVRWTIKEQKYCEQKFGYKTMVNEVLDKYVKSEFCKPHTGKLIEGIHCYDIRRNQKYS